ncbi:hypothetical protein ACFYVL_09155 [Streptomyces sp. NPDC004111]|uniref:hypothetical protein n=1 Tax=Streptomyces sp. NPDC004111 TaxID=3364690 RepID=UPI0036C39A83
MTEAPLPPADPAQLWLRISHTDDLLDTPHADALERWDVTVRHGRHVPGDALGPGQATDAEVGAMTFYRVHVDRGQNAHRALEEESDDLYEIAQAVLDPATGNLTEAASESLEYVGTGLLIMDRVYLAPEWRGAGLGKALAVEAIRRLMPGARAVVCTPGVTDLTGSALCDRAEWDRVTRKITRGWEQLGFRHHQGDVYLLSPASLELEEQCDEQRRHLATLAVRWRAAHPEAG